MLKDAKDEMVLATAVNGQADVLITSDLTELAAGPAAAVSIKLRAGSDKRGFRSKYHRAVCVSATPAITGCPQQNRETFPCGFHRFLRLTDRARSL